MPEAATPTAAQTTLAPPPAAARRKRAPKAPKVSCADCFFARNKLCALDMNEPCPTFRHHEQGLTPPQQLSFVFRQERRAEPFTFQPAGA